MCGIQRSAKLVIIALVIQKGLLISLGPNRGSAEMLWNLSRLALQKQSSKFPSQYQLHPEKYSKYTGNIKPIGIQNREPKSGDLEQSVAKLMVDQNYRKRFPQSNRPQSIGGAFQSIAQNDELGCIPRLLCELTSGVEQGSMFPFSVNMESIIGLVTAFSGTMSNPLLEFGRAALLGFTSKGNTRSCMFAYPECPQDPDRLVEYLNNYNGGFLKYFNGAPQEQQQQQPYYPQLQQLLPDRYGLDPYRKRKVQRRILVQNKEITFPYRFENGNRVTFAFPKSNEAEKSPSRQPMSFPDRTGTGELRLDPEELQISDSTNFYFREANQSGNFKFPSND